MKTIKEITDTLAQYEATHDVGSYRPFGWSVWPLVRITVGMDWLEEEVNPKTSNVVPVRTSSNRWVTYKYQFAAKLRGLKERISGRRFRQKSNIDVLIFTSTNRYTKLGESWGHYLSVPLAKALEDAGFSYAAIHCGTSPSATIGKEKPFYLWDQVGLSLFLDKLKADDIRKSPPVPPWYDDLRNSVHKEFPNMPSWDHFATAIIQIDRASELVAPVLKTIRPKVIFHDCWYGYPAMGVSLAARRLGIKCIDVQHGHQEHTHYSYHNWARRYEIVPDMFWVWGDKSAELHRREPSPMTILEGGNLWLNLWRTGDFDLGEQAKLRIRDIIKNRTSVLVTLSWPTEKYLAQTLEYIRTMPADWIWFLRLHPGRVADLGVSLDRTAQAGVTNAFLTEGTEWPLYALMSEVDLHVTFDSTCGSEALAFGKPTIVCHPMGRLYYQEFIEDSLMWYAEQPDEFRHAADHAIKETIPERLVAAANEFFASPAAAQKALNCLSGIIGRTAARVSS